MAAVAAMDFGRRLMWARGVPDPATDLQAFKNLAAARFWALLAQHVAKSPWIPQRHRGGPLWRVGPDHPFLYSDATGTRLLVRLPSGALGDAEEEAWVAARAAY